MWPIITTGIATVGVSTAMRLAMDLCPLPSVLTSIALVECTLGAKLFRLRYKGSWLLGLKVWIWLLGGMWSIVYGSTSVSLLTAAVLSVVAHVMDCAARYQIMCCLVSSVCALEYGLHSMDANCTGLVWTVMSLSMGNRMSIAHQARLDEGMPLYRPLGIGAVLSVLVAMGNHEWAAVERGHGLLLLGSLIGLGLTSLMFVVSGGWCRSSSELSVGVAVGYACAVLLWCVLYRDDDAPAHDHRGAVGAVASYCGYLYAAHKAGQSTAREGRFVSP